MTDPEPLRILTRHEWALVITAVVTLAAIARSRRSASAKRSSTSAVPRDRDSVTAEYTADQR